MYLIELHYRPHEQLKRLAGGLGKYEFVIPLRQLTRARKKAIELPHINAYLHDDKPSELEKELLVFYRGVVIAIPTVDNLCATPLESYRRKGWPGLKLHSDDHFALRYAADKLGGLPTDKTEK
ncbi:hypothetical protein HY492_03215 [Candidatus Woesearchaeota archaeon]|nr:hypothetical protein [Candidatus Woesearchaeota archaeon]